MTDTYRALCVELLAELENAIRVIYREDGTHHISTADAVIARADTALAAEPEPPADGEVTELVAWLRSLEDASVWFEEGTTEAKRLTRAADLLERLASPACVVLKPSPELIEAFKAAGYGRIEPMERLAPQPVPDGPTRRVYFDMPSQIAECGGPCSEGGPEACDCGALWKDEPVPDGPAVPEGREPAAVAEDPTDAELNETYWTTCHSHKDRTNSSVHIAGLRAVLARWGTPNLAQVRSSLGAAHD